MKKIVLAISLVIASSVNVFSQTKIDVTKIDYSILEQKIIEQVNTYRQKIGFKKLNVSTKLREKWSCVTVNANVKLDSCFHTLPKLQPEFALYDYAEIVFYTSKNITNTYKTYEDFSLMVLNGWLNSSGHKHVIETFSDDSDTYISCCVKQSKSGKFYIVVDFASMIIVKKT